MSTKYFPNRKSDWKRCLISPFIVFLLSLLSCSDRQTEFPNSDEPTLLNLTPSYEPTTSPSSTPIVIPTPTWTVVPTLSSEIQKQNLIELFLTNGNCNFPCWWGISSGDTIQKVSELAPIIGESLNIYGDFLYSYTLSLGNLNTPDLDVSLYSDANQIIEHIEVTLDQPSRFMDYYTAFEAHLSLANLLSRYGKPSEILFLVQPRFESGETPRSYTLFLIYDVLDFGIVYSGIVDSENPLKVCSIKLDNYYLQSISLYLQDPRSKIAEINRFNSTELVSLEQVTPMNLDDFYEVFTMPDNNKCIEADVDPWQ